MTDFDALPPGFLPKIERVPRSAITPPADERARAIALSRSVRALEDYGLEMQITPGEAEDARDAFVGTLPVNRRTSSAVVAKLGMLLDEYDHTVVHNAEQIRTFVTNRLLEESADKNPNIRMKALELLGKIGDVGLFTEKTEVTVHHQATSTIESRLKEKLSVLLDITDVEIIPEKGRTLSPDKVGPQEDFFDPQVKTAQEKAKLKEVHRILAENDPMELLSELE